MEEILNEVVSPAELEKFEKIYNRELSSSSQVTFKTQFEYAWCLVRSNLSADTKKGIALLEDLCSKDPSGKRDYIYYLAIGTTRIKEYTTALKFVRAFLEIEPKNQQVLALEEYIKKKLEREGIEGVVIGGSVALIVGGVVGLAFALLSKK